MSETNKTISRRLIEEVFNKGNLDLAEELVTADSVGHDPALPEETHGPEGLRQSVTGYRTGFGDLVIKVEDQIAEGDRVVTRWTGRGTHTGAIFGIDPTGKQTTVTGITIDRIVGGKIAESWTNWDTLGLMQQLGVVPPVTAQV